MFIVHFLIFKKFQILLLSQFFSRTFNLNLKDIPKKVSKIFNLKKLFANNLEPVVVGHGDDGACGLSL